MELWSDTNKWLELVLNLLLFVLPALAGMAATTAFGATLIASVRWFWRVLGRPAVNQGTDPLVKYIAKETGRNPEDVAKALTEIGDKVVSLLGPLVPEGEGKVNLKETVK